jgi:hypothetical protein
MFSFDEDGLARLHEMNRKLDNRVRQAIVFGADRRLDPRRVMARRFEHEVRGILAARGLIVTGTRHTERFDLLVLGIRVEVKASRWSGRYICNLHGNDADVLVWACVDEREGDSRIAPTYFVIPFEDVKGLTVIKIPSHDPRDYCGKWMRWCGAWDLIEELVAAGCNAWQPALMELKA